MHMLHHAKTMQFYWVASSQCVRQWRRIFELTLKLRPHCSKGHMNADDVMIVRSQDILRHGTVLTPEACMCTSMHTQAAGTIERSTTTGANVVALDITWLLATWRSSRI
jgi:hypothetical protein